MVKKIRVLSEDETPEDNSTTNNKELLELAKAMDWKLWEMLQVMQRLEKKISVLDGQDDN